MPMPNVTPADNSPKPVTVSGPLDDPFNVKIETWDDPSDGNIVFTAVSSNHKMSFSSADTCCSCTT